MTTTLETLASYVSSLTIRRFIADPAPLTEAQGERFEAAVLFADISGFTQLTETLAQRGPAGEEELTRLLNAYFGQLITLIAGHGGEIVKFAGDALLALWPATGQDLPTATLRAAQCGLTIQATLHNFQATDGVQLSLRVGIGAGEVFGVHLGGVFGRWEFLISGTPLSQMSHAEGQAQPGQVVLSPEAWTLVRAQCAGHPLTKGHVLLNNVLASLTPRPVAPLVPPPNIADALRGCIPAAVRARLDAGQSGWIAELRRVTVLFINLPDLKHDTPLAQAQAVMQALQ